MVRDEGDGPGQVLAGRLGPGAVEESKGIVPPAGELQGVGEAVLHGPHVGKAAAGVAEGHLAPGVPPEEEEAGVRLVRVGGLFLGGVDVVEHRLPCCGLGVEVVDNGHGLLRVDVVVPGQAEAPQGVPTPVPRVRGEEEAAVVPKHRVVHHGLDGGVGGVRACGHGGSLLWFGGRRCHRQAPFRCTRPGAGRGQRRCIPGTSSQSPVFRWFYPYHRKNETSREVSFFYVLVTPGFTALPEPSPPWPPLGGTWPPGERGPGRGAGQRGWCTPNPPEESSARGGRTASSPPP